ncbi:MAG: MbcA/ParS/Xre antitoxin family protein [Gemmatimonadaceae bacterium]
MRAAKDKAPKALNEHAPGALRTFFRVADAWELSAKEARLLLGNPPESTYYKWKSGKVGSVSRDLLERVSYLLGIYKALQLLLPIAAAADAWVRAPNEAPLFNGRSALDVMLSGNVADLYLVRQYVDAQRSGWA